MTVGEDSGFCLALATALVIFAAAMADTFVAALPFPVFFAPPLLPGAGCEGVRVVTGGGVEV